MSDSLTGTSRFISFILRHKPEVIGITDPLAVQVRNASFLVGTGEISIDEAVSDYGAFTD